MSEQKEKKPMSKKKKTILIIIGVLVLIGIAGALGGGGDDGGNDVVEPPVVAEAPEPDPEPVNGLVAIFGEVQAVEVVNFQGESLGEIGYVVAEYSSFTDDELIEFFYSSIYDSGFNWFRIEFGDGTGYIFPGSNNHFSHQQLDEDGSGIYPVGRSGSIIDGGIMWREFEPIEEINISDLPLDEAIEMSIIYALYRVDESLISVTGDDIYDVAVTLQARDFGNERTVLMDMLRGAGSIFESMQGREDLSSIQLEFTLDFFNVYGEVINETALFIELSNESLNRINFEVFDVTNYPAVADGFFVHPVLEG